MVIFHQDLLHEGITNNLDKYFIRSEVMFDRVKPIQTETDKNAFSLYKKAYNCYYTNPLKSKELETKAFEMSPELERVVV